MIKYGVKLWSNNSPRFFKEAAGLFKRGQIDLIELYAHPAMTETKKLKIFKGLPVTIHVAHYVHGFDLENLSGARLAIYKKAIAMADYLNAKKIIIHLSVKTDQANLKANFKKLYDPRLLMENMPKVSLDGQIFFGYTLKRLAWIKKNLGAEFCLDFSHAVKAASSQKLNYKKYLTDIVKLLKPVYFHLCDGDSRSGLDEHLDLGAGNFDLKWIKRLLLKLSRRQTIVLVFEVPKNKNDLKNDIKNIEYFKRLKA